jgi:hypothetical protein
MALSRWELNKKLLDCAAEIQFKLNCIEAGLNMRREKYPNEDLSQHENCRVAMMSASESLDDFVGVFAQDAAIT